MNHDILAMKCQSLHLTKNTHLALFSLAQATVLMERACIAFVLTHTGL